VYRRQYEDSRSPKLKLHYENKKNTFCGRRVSVSYPNSVENCFPTQNYTEIGQSAAELWPKTDFYNGGVRHLAVFKTFIFGHVTVIEFQICICAPNFIEIG